MMYLLIAATILVLLLAYIVIGYWLIGRHQEKVGDYFREIDEYYEK